MHTTRQSLLTEACTGSQPAWCGLVELYQPLIYGWLRRRDVDHHDAEELTQEVLAVLARELPQFSHSGRTGAFRRWICEITANRARAFWRSGRLREKATGRSSIRGFLEQLADDASDLSRQWDREHDRHVLRMLLEKVEGEFAAKTLMAFRRQVFDGEPAETVAGELEMSVSAAYSAKARVLRKLRREAAGLVDDSLLS